MPPQGAPMAPAPPMPPQAPQAGALPGFPADPGQALAQFKAAFELLRSERDRCAQIGIETDSTILPDEAQERKDRMEFLGQIGAFLQQSGPMVMQFPDMRGLLGAIMMFTVRTFRSSRPLEQEFERFQRILDGMPPMGPQGQGQGDPHAAQAQVASEQMKQQSVMQVAQMNDATNRYKIDTENQLRAAAENNRHNERMLELQIKQQELAIKQQELTISHRAQSLNEATAAADDARDNASMAHEQNMDITGQQHEQNMDMAGMQHDQNMDALGQQNTERQMTNDEQQAVAESGENGA
jgi:hypothetical protein